MQWLLLIIAKFRKLRFREINKPRDSKQKGKKPNSKSKVFSALYREHVDKNKHTHITNTNNSF